MSGHTVRVSASLLDRVVRCNASAALPQIVDGDDEGKDGRAKGHAVHKFLERVPEIGRDAALLEIDEKHRALCADIVIAKLAAQLRLSREVTLVYNWVEDTARIAVPVDGKVTIDRTCELTVRMDLLGVGDREVYVGDYKTGSGWLPDPEQSWQLGLGALAAVRFFGAKRAKVEYIRIRDDGTVRKFNADLDLFMLDAAAEKIASTMRAVIDLRRRVLGGEVPNAVEGRWCKYCPAKQHCPAKTALIRTVLHDPQPIPYVMPLTPEIALNAYVLLKKADDALAIIRSALYAYAKTTPIPLEVEEDGTERWFGELSREGNDVLDGKITHQVITAKYGPEVANKVVTMETTKKAIGDAVRENKAPDETQKAATEALYKAIKEAGGITNPITTTTVEYTVDPDGATKARRKKSA